ncbi:MAG: glycosyl transferase [Herpetosiphonaceae bacterium]|nr:MAG: glycosyl transferase [Herpetosiphonaceae bacterium]
MNVSLICTVKNEADNIADLIESMLGQSRPPDEIVINDCGSSDDTAAIVRRYIEQGAPIKLVSGGYNIPSGRNNAIRHASGPIIASTDAGLTLDPHWLERIVAPIERGEADIVGGFYRPAPRSLFEMALGATNYRDPEEVDGSRFLPAGQSVAFLKTAWEHVGGYPEWADHCEDLIFDRALVQAGYRLVFEPQAVIWFRPRASLRAFFRQYYFYARGDGIAGLWPKRHAIRYTSYMALLTVALLARRRPVLLLLLIPGVAAYIYGPYRRLWRRTMSWSMFRRLTALALVPIIRLTGDIAKMIGYPVGLLLRSSRRPVEV